MYLGVESSHEFNVNRLKRVSGGLNKVDTRVNAIVNDVGPMRFILGLKVRIKSRLDALQNGLPTEIRKRALYGETCLHC
jgi:hypothetical protein